MSVIISVLGCMRCGRCRSICETGALGHIDGLVSIDPEKCDLCMKCIDFCRNRALKPVEV